MDSGILIPQSSVLCMAASLAGMVLAPVLAVVFLKKRTGQKLYPLLVGALTFFVFVRFLENILHQVVLGVPGAGNLILNNGWAYAIYGGLAAGIFEEIGRFVAFKKLLKNERGKRISLMYGLGHGGIETFLVALSLVSTMTLAFAVNKMGIDAYIATIPAASADTVRNAAESIASQPAWIYLLSFLERLVAMGLHLSLSVLVYGAARCGKKWLLPAAIGIHSFSDMFAGLYQKGILTSVFLTEFLILAVMVITAVFARKLYLEYPDEIEKTADNSERIQQ
ncbi:YhfC family intramembrane metalloprotease [Lacrimispora sp. NSJ-141]|uniref:YhfC family intramembrane metalloprotease n=1 Tax=Lientehia hominis TaxID=2897778 RepID=A0AAP2RGE7_9FIRM|nr:YhfC family glutamic-type intramembrane protease [Lientehia hominis]MCD2491687.1 YhfC family intramembrane metalloprotease [Lientehia hominis]